MYVAFLLSVSIYIYGSFYFVILFSVLFLYFSENNKVDDQYMYIDALT